MNPVRNLSQKKFKLNFFCSVLTGTIKINKNLSKISLAPLEVLVIKIFVENFYEGY